MTRLRNPWGGIWRVAIGRVEGMAWFGATAQSFLSSLAPLIAFPLAGALLIMVEGEALPAFDLFALTLVLQLAPPVLSHWLAVRWGRADQWFHYATAYNWCYWAVPAAGSLLMLAAGPVLGPRAALEAFFIGGGAYSLWLHWFIARHGLTLGRWRAILLVVLVNGGTLLLVEGPRLVS